MSDLYIYEVPDKGHHTSQKLIERAAVDYHAMKHHDAGRVLMVTRVSDRAWRVAVQGRKHS